MDLQKQLNELEKLSFNGQITISEFRGRVQKYAETYHSLQLHKTNVSSSFLDCKKCNKGKVESVAKLKKDHVSVEIKKCSNCKYQYGIKELFKDNNIPFSFK